MLIVIYSSCIVLVVLSFIRLWWYNSFRVIVSSMFISLFFGIFDGIKVFVFSDILSFWA